MFYFLIKVYECNYFVDKFIHFHACDMVIIVLANFMYQRGWAKRCPDSILSVCICEGLSWRDEHLNWQTENSALLEPSSDVSTTGPGPVGTDWASSHWLPGFPGLWIWTGTTPPTLLSSHCAAGRRWDFSASTITWAISHNKSLSVCLCLSLYI